MHRIPLLLLIAASTLMSVETIEAQWTLTPIKWQAGGGITFDVTGPSNTDFTIEIQKHSSSGWGFHSNVSGTTDGNGDATISKSPLPLGSYRARLVINGTAQPGWEEFKVFPPPVPPGGGGPGTP